MWRWRDLVFLHSNNAHVHFPLYFTAAYLIKCLLGRQLYMHLSCANTLPNRPLVLMRECGCACKLHTTLMEISNCAGDHQVERFFITFIKCSLVYVIVKNYYLYTSTQYRPEKCSPNVLQMLLRKANLSFIKNSLVNVVSSAILSPAACREHGVLVSGGEPQPL